MGQLPNEREFGDYAQWPGRAVLDAAGDRLGDIREIYLDRESGRPEWVLVDVEADEPRFVPLAGANVEPEAIRIAHTADVVHNAPSIGPEAHIDPDHERRLYAHYGLDYSEDESASGLPKDTEPQAAAKPAEEPTNLAPPPAEPPTPEELEAAGIPEPPAVRDEEATPPEPAADEPAPLWSEAASEEAPPPAGEEPEPAVAAPGVPGPALSDAPEAGDESIPEVPAPGVPATEEAAPLPPSPPEPPPPVFTPPPYEPETARLPVLATRRRLGLAVGAAGLAAVLFFLIRRLRD